MNKGRRKCECMNAGFTAVIWFFRTKSVERVRPWEEHLVATLWIRRLWFLCYCFNQHSSQKHDNLLCFVYLCVMCVASYSQTVFYLQHFFSWHICVLVCLTLSPAYLSPLISFSDTWRRPRLSLLIQLEGWRVSLNKQSEREALSACVSETSPYVNRRLIWQRGRHLHRRHELPLPLRCVYSI